MRVSTFALAVLLLPLGAGPLAAQPAGDDSAAVSAVVSAFHAGLRSGDAAAVMQLIADDALLLEAGGVETRAEYGKNHLPADIEFEKSGGDQTQPDSRGRQRQFRLGQLDQRVQRDVSGTGRRLAWRRADGAQPRAGRLADPGHSLVGPRAQTRAMTATAVTI